MFKINPTGINSRKKLIKNAVVRLPEAHNAARHVGLNYLHEQASEAVSSAGHDPAPLGIFYRQNQPYIGIQDGPEGDSLADLEYGSVTEAPNPIIRQAIRANHPSANSLYNKVLWEELGRK